MCPRRSHVCVLQMDELDDMFLSGFGRGPPPAKFMCNLSNEIMREPIRNPHVSKYDEPSWFDRCSLLQLLTKDDDVWPGTRKELNEDDIFEMAVDEELADEIAEWQSRQNGF